MKRAGPPAFEASIARPVGKDMTYLGCSRGLQRINSSPAFCCSFEFCAKREETVFYRTTNESPRHCQLEMRSCETISPTYSATKCPFGMVRRALSPKPFQGHKIHQPASNPISKKKHQPEERSSCNPNQIPGSHLPPSALRRLGPKSRNRRAATTPLKTREGPVAFEGPVQKISARSS